MSSKPLQYLSTITVMLYLDPYQRIEIMTHMPEIRLTERLIPLRIQHLSMGLFLMKMNKISYSIEPIYPIIDPEYPKFQLIVGSAEGRKRVYTSKFNKDDSLKELHRAVFGHRRIRTKIHLLSISSRKEDPFRFWREEIKFHVRNVKVPTLQNPYFDQVARVLTPASLPLDTIESDEFVWNFQELEHPIVRSAKRLIVDTLQLSSDFGTKFKDWKYQTVELKRVGSLEGVGYIMEMVENWIEHGKGVGTCYKFGMTIEKIEEIMEAIRAREEIVEISEKIVKLGMLTGSRIAVSFEKQPEMFSHDAVEPEPPMGLLEFKVVEFYE